ncbi:MAG: glycosyltransferase, partial [Armatimonadota bacterium]
VVEGDGPIMGELRGLADSLGLNGRVIFTGLRHDAPRLITTFDVFMLSSIHEGLPVAVLEAMALNRPVVATRVGGLPGVLHDGVHGFLVDTGNPAALAEKVLMLLRNPDLRQAMGEASKRRVEQHFSIQRMVREMEQVYAEILDDKSAARQRWTPDARG